MADCENGVEIDPLGSSAPRTAPCPAQTSRPSISVGHQLIVEDRLGNQSLLRLLPNAILLTDALGRIYFADGINEPIRLAPQAPDADEQMVGFYGLASSPKLPRPELRTFPPSVIRGIAEAHVDSLISAAISEALTAALSGSIEDLILQKISAATFSSFRVGDWKMRLDDVIPPNWFRTGERFARSIYPELYELLGTDEVPEFRGRFLRQLIPGVDEPASVSAACPGGTGCAAEDQIKWVNVNWMIYGGIPATCDEITAVS